MDKTTSLFIIGSIALVFIVLAIILFVIFKNKKYKKYDEEINKLEVLKNSIISSSLLQELKNVENLINNDNLKNKYNNWVKNYDEIKDKEIIKVTDELVDLESLLSAKKYKELEKSLTLAELNISVLKAKSDKLVEEIREITMSEKKNREAVTSLKSTYREIINKYNKNKNDYKDINSSIDLQFENIDRMLAAFESAMENKEYENISKIVKALTGLISNIKMVIDEAPTIIFMGKIVVPKKINEIKNIYRKMTKDSYNLEYLNIEYNIEETNKKLSDIFDRLNVLDIEDSIFELKTMLSYFESLYTDFEHEKQSKKSFERSINYINEKLDRMFKLIKNLYYELNDLKSTYDLSDDELKLVEGIRKELVTLKDGYKILSDRTQVKIIPYSKLYHNSELLSVKIASIEDNLESTLRNLGSLKEDEIRAREQLLEIREILSSSKNRIREFKLPVVPKNYFIELKEASEAIDNIIIELEKKPISIKTLNTRVDTARDLALKLYSTCNETYKVASMAEMSIVYGNRYRSSYSEIETGLTKAEKEFYKGNYKESLEISINTLNIVETGIYKKLLSAYEK